jgi:hypothetical protein
MDGYGYIYVSNFFGDNIKRIDFYGNVSAGVCGLPSSCAAT